MNKQPLRFQRPLLLHELLQLILLAIICWLSVTLPVCTPWAGQPHRPGTTLGWRRGSNEMAALHQIHPRIHLPRQPQLLRLQNPPPHPFLMRITLLFTKRQVVRHGADLDQPLFLGDTLVTRIIFISPLWKQNISLRSHLKKIADR